METIKGKGEDNDFVMNSTEQTGKIFSISCENKNTIEGNTRTYIKRFFQTMLMIIIYTPEVSK